MLCHRQQNATTAVLWFLKLIWVSMLTRNDMMLRFYKYGKTRQIKPGPSVCLCS
jgi:hypothetical protein